MVVQKNTQWVLDMDNTYIKQININITESSNPPYKYNYTLNLKYVGENGETYSLAHYSNWFTDNFKSHLKQFFTNKSYHKDLIRKINDLSLNHKGMIELDTKFSENDFIKDFYEHVDKYNSNDIINILNIDKKTLDKLINDYDDKFKYNTNPHTINHDTFLFRIDDISKLFIDLFIKTSDKISTDKISQSVTPYTLEQLVDKIETTSSLDICDEDDCIDKNQISQYINTELEKIKIKDKNQYNNAINKLEKNKIFINEPEKLLGSIREYTLKFLPDLKHNEKLSSNQLHILELENFISNMFNTKDTQIDIEDVNGQNVYQPTLNSIHLDYKRNKSFRDCVDDLLNDDDLIELFENKDRKKIVELLKKISELGPHDYMRCMKRLENKNYCGSDVVHSYMQVLIMVFNYFGSNIDIDKIDKNSNTDDVLVNESLPYVKKIYNNILLHARTINDYNNCNDSDNKIIDRYQNIYDSLFDIKSCDTTYSLFDNYKLPGIDRITEYATEHTLIFIIILIFISFIFSKFVTMLSAQPVVPVNKNIV